MTPPVFVCFYTTEYIQHAMNLRPSLERFDLSHDLHFVTDKGSWAANCHRKPAFLRAMLLRHKGPIVWIDADARMRQRPDVLLEMAATRHADIGVHDYGLSGGRSEILSGTIYLDDTAAAHALLDAWQDKCAQKPGAYDQQALQWALEQWEERDATGPLRVASLPAEYTFIFDIFRSDFYKRNHPNVGPPVIEHMQHSRVVRAKEKAK